MKIKGNTEIIDGRIKYNLNIRSISRYFGIIGSNMYSLKRFWCLWEGEYRLTDEGYLYDPESDPLGNLCPDIVPFQSISQSQCLILLGEPGIGKTSALNAEAKSIDAEIKTAGGRTLRLDLSLITSDTDLSENLFKSKIFKDWTKSEYKLHIFLDSLDECLFIDKLAAKLIVKLKGCPKERLYLRIACRTADWQRLRRLEHDLKNIWDNDQVKVYELLPLRRVDVEEAATANGLEPMRFLSIIEKKEAVPLAIKPITLKFLVKTYLDKNNIPFGKVELYEKGCKLLCKETNDNRIASQRIGKLTADQRLIISARIATIMIFSMKNIINLDDIYSNDPRNELTIQSLCGGKESATGSDFDVIEPVVIETLNIGGLFNSRGENRMGWSHQTYAEFLAAWYLTHHSIASNQIRSLLYHPMGRVVPQLQGVASWLCTMNTSIFEDVLKTNPEILLFSDLSIIEEKSRVILVDNLLQLYEENKLTDPILIHKYNKLNHPNLAEQLESYIFNKEKNTIVRQIAISIAEACAIKPLLKSLLSIILDLSDDLNVRTWAAHAVISIDDNETKRKIKPLALNEAGDDPDDELKGVGLQAVWPDFLTAEELFSILTNPKKQNFFGSYYNFISYSLIDGLTEEDFPIALNWIESQRPRQEIQCLYLRDLIDSILVEAHLHLKSTHVLVAFAKAIFSRLKADYVIIENRPKNTIKFEIRERRSILEILIPLFTNPKQDSSSLAYSDTPLVLREDIPWLISKLERSESDQHQRGWAELIDKIFDIQAMSEYSDLILQACRRNTILDELLSPYIKPIKLNSLEAEKMKERYSRKLMLERQRGKCIKLDTTPQKSILDYLDEFDSGDHNAWWQLNYRMLFDEQNRMPQKELESDLTQLPGWVSGKPSDRLRIVKAAKRYLLEYNLDTYKWIGTNNIYRPAFAGYRALRLILQKDPEFLDTMPIQIWKKWSPIIIAYPELEAVEVQKNLVKKAFEYAHNEIINALNAIINKENTESDKIFIINIIDELWDTRIEIFLSDKVKDQSLKLECMCDLLRPLLEHDVEDIKTYAESFIISPPPSFGEDRKNAIIVAKTLMSYAKDACWPIIWPAFKQDNSFGQEVLMAIEREQGLRSAAIQLRLGEDQLSDLYIWLCKRYPYFENPVEGEAHFVTVRERIEDWRDSILSHLSEIGAYQAFNRIAEEIPGLEIIKWMQNEAVKNYCIKSFNPIEPQYILELIGNQEKRLVNSGSQLVEVLIESLSRLEKDLHDETPASRDIWDLVDRKNKQYIPIYEEELSDYVKRHLKNDIGKKGVILGREVKIRPHEITDIHVDALKEGGNDFETVSAIIEVKGCWNRELDLAMQCQLKDRYLKDSSCRQGIYLIGWFNCDNWDKSDYRYRDSPKISLEEARIKFNAQATNLSNKDFQIKAFILDCKI